VSAPAVVRMKICMAGEATVGKTSLIRRSVLDEYDDRYIATLGTKITKKVMSVRNPKGADLVTVHAILWDIMGTPTLRDLLKEAYYHGAEGIFAVADQTRKETLAALDAWSRSIRSVAGDIPTFGLVNKQDLDPDPRFVAGEIEAFFEKRGWPWVYTSAKTGAGVEVGFQRLVETILADRPALRSDASGDGPPRPS
jgi:GTPase SAR1 family protein